MPKPKVSIVSITYNHEKFIQQALEGFVNQKANFDYEIVVADDCSTDKTPEIIKEFTRLYPDKMKPILRNKNIGAQDNSISALKEAKGAYVALCEGDDFWIDDHKLQKQVNFLDQNNDYSLCFHPVKVIFENLKENSSTYPASNDISKFTIEELLKHNFIQTDSVMYRRQNYKYIPRDIMPLDWYLHLYHAQFGKIGFIDKVMSVYRKHPSGIWWNSDKNIDEIWKKYGIAHLGLYGEFLKLYGKQTKYKEIIYGHINNMFDTLTRLEEDKAGYLRKAAEEYPDLAGLFINYQYKTIKAKKAEISNLNDTITDKDHQLQELRQEIRAIKSSRTWKARNQVARIIGKDQV